MLTSLDSLVLQKICSFLNTNDAKNFRLCCKHVAVRVNVNKIEYGHISKRPVLFDKHLVYRKATTENNIIPDKQIAAWSEGLDRAVLKLVWTTSLKIQTEFKIF